MRPIAFTVALLGALLLPTSTALADPGWAWPVRGPVLTPFVNGDDPYAAGQHRGVDLGAPVGTPVVAAAAGTVVYAGVVGSSGLTVAERSGDYELSYLHLSSAAVRSGDHVEAGARIGAVGVSGVRSADQPHLHFGVRQAADRHAYLDPLRFLAPPPTGDPEPHAAPVPAREPAPHAAPAVVAPAPPAVAPSAAPGASLPPAHVGHPAPGPHPVPARTHAPALAPAPAGHVSSAAHLTPRPHVVLAARHGHVARTSPAPAHGPSAQPVAASSPPGTPARARPAGHHGGVDAGWLAACAGLVLAAALLARPGARDRGGPSTRSALAALVRAATAPARAGSRQ